MPAELYLLQFGDSECCIYLRTGSLTMLTFVLSNGGESEVAMKELTLQLEEMDEQAAQAFLVEIRLMNALRHSRVVRLEGVAYNDGRLYLVTVSPPPDSCSPDFSL